MNNTRYRLDSSLPTRDYLHYFVATPRQTVAAVGLPTAMDTQEELADLRSQLSQSIELRSAGALLRHLDWDGLRLIVDCTAIGLRLLVKWPAHSSALPQRRAEPCSHCAPRSKRPSSTRSFASAQRLFATCLFAQPWPRQARLRLR